MNNPIRHQPSGAPALILKATILWFVIGILAVGNGVMREALLEPGLGVYWLVLTILFESGLGLILLEQSWEHVLRQCSLAGGNLWLLVLSVITVAPWLAGKMRGLN